MKKTIILMVMAVLSVMLIVSCSGPSGEPSSYSSGSSRKPTSYIVTFDSKDGSAVEPQTVDKGARITRPADPTKTGSYLASWKKDDGTKFDFKKDRVNSNMTLTAEWKQVYQVKDTGPAGGTVFYDVDADNDKAQSDNLNSYDCGWRYLEAAALDAFFGEQTTFRFCYLRDSDEGESYCVGVYTAECYNIGKGASNTKKIIEKMGTGECYNSLTGPDKDQMYAAGIVNYINENKTEEFGNKDDWFLPSADEALTMFKVLNLPDRYWTSTETSSLSNSERALEVALMIGAPNYGDTSKGNSLKVRPVRCF